MTVQISWPHMFFMFYMAMVLFSMLLLQPYLFKVSKNPIWAVIWFGITWPLHAIPKLIRTVWWTYGKWRRERFYKALQERRLNRLRKAYAPVRSSSR